MQKNLVVAIQDMGAAGLTSSSFEMAAKGDVGLDLHLDKVPIRDQSIQPEEILLSESQERMLLICEPSKFESIQKIFDHWGLDAAVIGEVRSERKVRIFWKNELLSDLDPHLLTENAPNYDRPHSIWKPKFQVKELSKGPEFNKQMLLGSLSSLEGCSRDWIYRQYDQRVGTLTHRDATHSVAVVRLPDSQRGLGIVLGCRPSIMRMDVREGAKDAAFYPALELAVKGFEPLALTDCLNFGNPEKPELMTELVAAIDGLAEASKALEAPVISGNVSLYNETLNKNVTSTPSTGWVGLRPDMERIPSDRFQSVGNEVWRVSLPMLQFAGQWADKSQRLEFVGEIDSSQAAQLVKSLTDVARSPKIKASRVVGKFGRPYALARMSLGGKGAKITDSLFESGQAWAEPLYEVLFEVEPGESTLENLKSHTQLSGLVVEKIGEVIESELKLGDVHVSLSEIETAYHSGWKNEFKELA